MYSTYAKLTGPNWSTYQAVTSYSSMHIVRSIIYSAPLLLRACPGFWAVSQSGDRRWLRGYRRTAGSTATGTSASAWEVSSSSSWSSFSPPPACARFKCEGCGFRCWRWWPSTSLYRFEWHIRHSWIKHSKYRTMDGHIAVLTPHTRTSWINVQKARFRTVWGLRMPFCNVSVSCKLLHQPLQRI